MNEVERGGGSGEGGREGRREYVNEVEGGGSGEGGREGRRE